MTTIPVQVLPISKLSVTIRSQICYILVSFDTFYIELTLFRVRTVYTAPIRRIPFIFSRLLKSSSFFASLITAFRTENQSHCLYTNCYSKPRPTTTLINLDLLQPKLSEIKAVFSAFGRQPKMRRIILHHRINRTDVDDFLPILWESEENRDESNISTTNFNSGKLQLRRLSSRGPRNWF